MIHKSIESDQSSFFTFSDGVTRRFRTPTHVLTPRFVSDPRGPSDIRVEVVRGRRFDFEVERLIARLKARIENSHPEAQCEALIDVGAALLVGDSVLDAMQARKLFTGLETDRFVEFAQFLLALVAESLDARPSRALTHEQA